MPSLLTFNQKTKDTTIADMKKIHDYLNDLYNKKQAIRNEGN